MIISFSLADGLQFFVSTLVFHGTGFLAHLFLNELVELFPRVHLPLVPYWLLFGHLGRFWVHS